MVQKALDLRTAGVAYSSIGQALGISKTRAYELVMLGLEELAESIVETATRVRDLELRRLDAIVMAHHPQRQNPRNAEILLKASKRRSEILGLDAPTKIAQTTPDGAEALPTEIRITLVKPSDGGA